MAFLKKISIRNKIIILVLFTTIVVVGIGFTMISIKDLRTIKKEMVYNTSLQAKLIAEYSITPLLFNDEEGASSILHKLDKIPFVYCGLLYTNKGVLFAKYLRHKNFLISYKYKPKETTFFQDDYLYVNEPVEFDSEKYGSVILIASTGNLKEKVNNYILTLAFIVCALIVIAFIMAVWSQRIISGPLLHLATLTDQIAKTENYNVQISKDSEDEIGILYDSFNHMIGKVKERQEERDKALDELKLERENLERNVADRTRELEEAKRKAEESDHLKTSFLANMSHEIRTPLNSIIGFSSFLSDCDKHSLERRKKYKEYIIESGKDLMKLIDDILDIAKIEANQITVRNEKCRINPIIEDAFEIFEHTLKLERRDKMVKPVINIPDYKSDYELISDPLRIKQIVINILNNAIKFTEKGFIEIGYIVDENQKLLDIYIKDTGIGIPKDKLDTIFNRFTKLENDRTKLYRGTGLGLSIAMKLSELLKGKITVESELDKGSVFHFYLYYSGKIKSTPKILIEESDIDYIDFKNKTILIVEDEVRNFKYLEQIFVNHTNAQIIWAVNGNEAIKICRDKPEINLVLMDLQLPELNGFDATRVIKKIRKDLPIIAQTAYAMSDEKLQSIEAGCDDFIAKPINKNELLKKVSDFLLG